MGRGHPWTHTERKNGAKPVYVAIGLARHVSSHVGAASTGAAENAFAAEMHAHCGMSDSQRA